MLIHSFFFPKSQAFPVFHILGFLTLVPKRRKWFTIQEDC